jgi:hypothetical protein
MDLTLSAKIAIAIAAALLFSWRIIAMQRREHHGKDHMLDGFLPELQDARLGWASWRYPTIEGRLDDAPVRIDLIPDTLVVRALPTLYLEARWAHQSRSRLRVILEPNGAEYFAEENGLRVRLAPPLRWPQSAEVRGSDRESKILLRRLAALPLSDYPSLKQLSLSEKEAKVTLRCAKGERLTYRVLRSATFPPDAVTPALVSQALTLVRSVRKTLMASEGTDS